MQCVHSCVPAAAHKHKESESEQLHAQQFADIAAYEQECENDEPGQDNADGTLCQYSESGEESRCIVEPPVMPVPEVEKDE